MPQKFIKPTGVSGTDPEPDCGSEFDLSQQVGELLKELKEAERAVRRLELLCDLLALTALLGVAACVVLVWGN